MCIVFSLAFVLSCVCQLVLKNYDDDDDDKASTSTCWDFVRCYVVIATKPVNRLQICPIVHN